MIDQMQDFIFEANQQLKPLEEEIIKNYSQPEGPVFFIVGAPRSGTTVLLQTILNHFELGYINNLIAKYWEAPVIGAAFFRTLSNSKPALSYYSDGGFTSEILGPHEFGYFWKRFFHYGETHQLSREQQKQINVETLNREIAGLEKVLGKPLIFKNPAALSLQIEFLGNQIPNSYFIYIKRDPFYIAQSLYLKRIEKFNDPEIWYSVKPAMYPKLIKESPSCQIAGQVYYTIEKIEKDLTNLSTSRFTTISYEAFCEKPGQSLDSCRELVNFRRNDTLEKLDNLRFNVNNQVLVDPETENALRSDLSQLFFSS